MISELKMAQEQAIVSCFKVFIPVFVQREKVSQGSWSPGRDLNQGLPNTRQEYKPLYCDVQRTIVSRDIKYRSICNKHSKGSLGEKQQRLLNYTSNISVSFVDCTSYITRMIKQRANMHKTHWRDEKFAQCLSPIN